MKFYELILIGLSLAMDAFAVSLCKGLSMKKFNHRHAVIIALFFGGFQMLMPCLGYLLGTLLDDFIGDYDHWIAFSLLCFLGGKMIFEAIKSKSDEAACDCEKLNYKELTVMSVATSIDALAVGITFAFLEVSLLVSATTIGVITFILCYIGVIAGFKFGAKNRKAAEIAGGVILILMGLKILLESIL